jgi:hypothetical protein
MAAEGEAPEPEGPPQIFALSDEIVEGRQLIMDEIFAGVQTQALKEKAREERQTKEELAEAKGLVYSEVDLKTMHTVLAKIKTEISDLYSGKGIFLDLGSGCGKACIAAGLLHPFQKVVGIERVQCLLDTAAAAMPKYQEAALQDGMEKPEIEFIAGDFVGEFEAKVEPILPEVAVAFANATCFAEEQMATVEKLANLMPYESILVTVTHKLPESLIIDENRNPKQRHSAAVKKALATRGTDPDLVKIEVEEPVNDPKGWYPVHECAVELAHGKMTCFVYKKAKAPPETEQVEEPPEE